MKPRTTARVAIAAGLSVFVAGEWWNAELESDDSSADSPGQDDDTKIRVQKGDEVEIVGMTGYTLRVKPLS